MFTTQPHPDFSQTCTQKILIKVVITADEHLQNTPINIKMSNTTFSRNRQSIAFSYFKNVTKINFDKIGFQSATL